MSQKKKSPISQQDGSNWTMMFPFKMVFMTFFTAPDVCGDVWKYVAGMGLHYTLNPQENLATNVDHWPISRKYHAYWMRDIPPFT